jgi:thermostable 8-oxoguanine DNA glycosylase
MIEPARITNFERSPAELEELLLFCAFLGRHGARDTATALQMFLSTVHLREHLKEFQPFEGLRRLGRRDDLAAVMQSHGLRSPQKNARTIAALVECGLDLRTCTVEQLEKIPGITPSAARLFLLHSRGKQPYACLDGDVLRDLRQQGLDAPARPPADPKEYRRLEQQFLKLAKEAGKTPAELDQEIRMAAEAARARRRYGAGAKRA